MEKLMEKLNVRSWVRETLEGILIGEINEGTFGNVKLCYCEYFDNILTSELFIKVHSYGKWNEKDYFRFSDYFSNYYEMITRMWLNDMVNDVTDYIMSQKDIDTSNNVIE